MSTPTLAPAPLRFVCRGWTVGDKHYDCLTPSRPHFRDGQCAPCAETERIGRKRGRDPWVSLNDIDLEGEARQMTAIARMPDAAVTKVDLTKRRWSRDYDACIGWGAADGPEHHDCASPEGTEFDPGRCYRCFTAHMRWQTGRQAAPAALTLTVPHADPASTSDSSPVPTPQEVVPRNWHRHYDCCVQCGTTEKKPASRGLCTTCYPLSTQQRYRGNAGPRLDRSMSEVEQRALVDAYLATISIPTPAAPTAHATPVPAQPTPIAPPPPPDPPHPVIVAAVREAETTLANDDEPQWTVFVGGPTSQPTAPYLTWGRGGLLTLPAPTLALVGSPTHVVLLWDPARRLVGLRAATAETAHARQLPPPENHRGTVSLSIRALINACGLADVPPGRYPVRQFGPVVAIQLPPPTAAQP